MKLMPFRVGKEERREVRGGGEGEREYKKGKGDGENEGILARSLAFE